MSNKVLSSLYCSLRDAQSKAALGAKRLDREKHQGRSLPKASNPRP
jgi:hypothetical protein